MGAVPVALAFAVAAVGGAAIVDDMVNAQERDRAGRDAETARVDRPRRDQVVASVR
jgi:hypothetical protein